MTNHQGGLAISLPYRSRSAAGSSHLPAARTRPGPEVCLVTQHDPRVAAVVTSGRSPFRRRVDDVESAIMSGLVVVFLIAAPVLGAVSRAAG